MGILPAMWNGHLACDVEWASCPRCGMGILPVMGCTSRLMESAVTTKNHKIIQQRQLF
ncbi:hypothetical protein [Okeania sp. SIO3B5]|uniref:hypothetical protein n=1 Tax=Okeania sp. SIO3B5 TaxID=2607811 RepID=UPI0025DFDA52|nr:hypothetical protein [Okeania sp. SIO3B5]